MQVHFHDAPKNGLSRIQTNGAMLSRLAKRCWQMFLAAALQLYLAAQRDCTFKFGHRKETEIAQADTSFGTQSPYFCNRLFSILVPEPASFVTEAHRSADSGNFRYCPGFHEDRLFVDPAAPRIFL